MNSCPWNALLLLAVTACGGSAHRDSPATGKGGSAGAAGTLTSSGGWRASGGSPAGGSTGGGGLAEAGAPSSAGAAGEPGWVPERPVCGGSAQPGNIDAFCSDPVTLGEPEIVDIDGDAIVNAGDLLQLHLLMTNETNSSLAYPCLGLAVEQEFAMLPLDEMGGAIENPIFSGTYGLGNGSAIYFDFFVKLADDVPPGTSVRFLAWADALNTGCTDSGELEFQIDVE